VSRAIHVKSMALVVSLFVIFEPLSNILYAVRFNACTAHVQALNQCFIQSCNPGGPGGVSGGADTKRRCKIFDDLLFTNFRGPSVEKRNSGHNFHQISGQFQDLLSIKTTCQRKLNC
jgi:hypothetical protein